MFAPYEASGFRYAVCRSEDLAEMRQLLAEAFTRRDPLAAVVGLTSREFEHFVEIVSQTALSDQLTIVAREAASGKMAGALLADDAAAPAPSDLDRISKKFDPIHGLLAELEEKYRFGRTVASGDYLHLFLLGVSDRFAGRGIGQQLVRACLANGAALGFRMAVTEATNPVSQHIFAKSGFATRAQVAYADYETGGVTVFASVAQDGGTMAMDRAITPAHRGSPS